MKICMKRITTMCKEAIEGDALPVVGGGGSF